MLRDRRVCAPVIIVISLLLLSVLPAGFTIGNGFPSTAAAAARIRGFLVGWGDNSYRQVNVPLDVDFVSISAGGSHSLALRENGTLAAWGDNSKGQTNVPTGSGFTAISAGGTHSLALRADGTIAGWGDNSQGQANVPAGTNLVAIAAGGAHSLALRANGTITGWGDNSQGQIDVPAGSGFTAISAGGSHSLALRANGTVTGWGDNRREQLDTPAGPDFLAISAGGAHSLAIAVAAPAKPKPRKVYWNILAVADPGGTITPGGDIRVLNGSDQSFVISPDAGCRIKDVLVDGISMGALPAYDFIDVVADHTIEAIFISDHTITATAGMGGTISPAGTMTVEDGKDQSFTIAAVTGYTIKDVLVDGVSVGKVAAYTFKGVVADHTIHADFVPDHTITATAGKGGTITPSGAAKIKDGADQSFNIAADTGFVIGDVLVDGVSVGAVATYTFPGVVADHAIHVEFAQAGFTVTATGKGAGSVSPAVQTVNAGGNASVVIAPDIFPEFALIGLKDNGEDVPIKEPAGFTYIITNVQGDHVIEATFGAPA